ncbi:MAG: hypothetical protein AB1894_19560 [Chloroflexota bacterium]
MRKRMGRWQKVWLLVLALAVLLGVSQAASAKPDAGYGIGWWTVDGGGGGGGAGGYMLRGTGGQADAAMMAQSPYALTGGYWGATYRYVKLLPLVYNQY